MTHNGQAGQDACRHHRMLRAAVLAMGTAAIAALGASGDGGAAGPVPVALPWPLLVAAFLLAELHIFDLHVRGESQSFSLNEVPLVLGLFLVDPWVLVATMLAGSAIAMVVQRTGATKLVYNLAQLALGTAAAAAVFGELATPASPFAVRNWAAALAACATAAVVSCASIAFAIVVVEGRVPVSSLVRTLAFGLAGTVLNTMLGLVAVVVVWHEPSAALLLAGPLAATLVAYRAYLSERARSDGIRFLYRASQVLNGAENIEAGLVSLLDVTRDTLHADLAEIVVVGGDDDGHVFVTTVGPGAHRESMRAVPRSELADLLAQADRPTARAFDAAAAAARFPARDGFEPGAAMLAPLRGDDGLRGAVLVANPAGSVRRFGRDELHLFQTFANHLGVTLDRSHLSTSLAQVTALKTELAFRAYHDSLTGLPNRALFRERVTSALERAGATGGGVAVLFVDLDDFKTVNDTMGHAAGDTLLAVVGERIESCIRKGDLAARLGGDEFAVLLVDAVSEHDVRHVADRILCALGDPIDVDGQAVVAHASIGVATHASAADADELMANADVAMYTAKRNGKGRFDVFEPSLSLSVARRHQVKVGLERAIATDEFVLQYQPVVDVASGEIVATEALLRWRDPARGLLPPAEFMGIAEETGLIVPIGRLVIQKALAQAAQWCGITPGLKMFVNVSARQLTDPGLVADVAGALGRSGIDPRQVVLEVTETAMMQDIEAARATLLALKELGVGIGVDDFGTGYSSLSYLRRLPIDMLKIAKPFVDGIDDTPEDTAFVHGIVQLGHVVGLHVVAEGVERLEQSAHLVDMGCNSAQGFLYSESVDAAAVTALLRARARERAAAPS